jgi:hypothetical protein
MYGESERWIQALSMVDTNFVWASDNVGSKSEGNRYFEGEDRARVGMPVRTAWKSLIQGGQVCKEKNLLEKRSREGQGLATLGRGSVAGL